ncbi:MAG: AAA family ATPase [Jiangellaceae bacterium]
MKRAPLVGRDGERADLDAVLAGCREGAGGLMLVSGDAGVGKSRLVSEVLDGWDGNILRGAATLGDSAYAPVVEVLRGVSDRFGDGALAGHARVLLPELALPWRDIDREALVAAIHRTVREVARRQPTVVLLEDLHWGSAATIELLPALAASIAREPLLFLGTYRGAELPRAHPVRGLRAELRRRGLLVELALGRSPARRQASCWPACWTQRRPLPSRRRCTTARRNNGCMRRSGATDRSTGGDLDLTDEAPRQSSSSTRQKVSARSRTGEDRADRGWATEGPPSS